MGGVRPAILKANRQHRVFGVSRGDRVFVIWMSITFDGCHEAGAEHHGRRASQQRLADALPVANAARSDYGRLVRLVQNIRQRLVQASIRCTWPPASVPWQTR